MNRDKGWVIRLSMIFAGVLLFLTFFSNTLYSLNLPGVVVGRPGGNIVETTFRASGAVDFALHENLLAQTGGIIEFHVAAGYAVSYADPLFTIRMDGWDLLNQLNAEQARLYALLAHKERLEEEREYLEYTEYPEYLEDEEDPEDEEYPEYPEIEPLEFELNLIIADIEAAENRIYEIRQIMAAGGEITTYAQFAGVIRAIAPELFDGAVVAANRYILRKANTEGGRLIVTAEFPERAGRLREGHPVRIDIPFVDERGLTGHVRRVYMVGNRVRSEIAIISTAPIQGGERADIILETFSAFSGQHQTLPNSAIRTDQNGDYIAMILREPNPLFGYGYFTRQIRITTAERGDRYTAFTAGEDISGPVVLSSDRHFVMGNRVRVVGDR
ncbi:MAG: hypothetical protein FWB71_06430 [Defluviitaleaceae bacterium]|nr:hypothetical protein [Defluviitaleaceae bacterium]